MANWLSDNGPCKFRITIPRYTLNNYFTEYELVVQFPKNINWKVSKRYSHFLKLNEELANLDSKFKVYFPPKKLFKNTSERFLNQRKKSLEMYMNEILSIINNYLPRPLAAFIEIEKYEIHGITTNLAKLLFKHGEALVTSNKTFEISVLSIYAINQRMVSPAPTNIYNKCDEDFGNVLEVIESTKSIKIIPHSVCIQGQDSSLGSSNIKSSTLPFDISIFCGANSLELNSVEISNLRGLYKMNPIVENLKAHHCLKSLEDILFGDLVYRSSLVEDLLNFDGPWRCVLEVDFSKNSITSIDKSVVTLKQVSNLNLSYNQISNIKNLHYLTFLTVLDLSYNNLVMCQDLSFSNKLGSIKQLCLRGNKLTKLLIVDRMFSLEYLDISENEISEFSALLPLCRLSCIESLILKKNPICESRDFFIVLFDIFLDQLNSVQINGMGFSEMFPQIQSDVFDRRTLKESILIDSLCPQSLSDSSGEIKPTKEFRNMLMSINIDTKNLTKHQTILNVPDVFNVLIYWFYSAIKKPIVPSKILWCTEIFSPNRCIKPAPVLLISSSSLNASMLKCSVKNLLGSNGAIITIQPCNFIDLNKGLRNLVVGADKMFIRFDFSYDSRCLYLVNSALSVDSFMGHLYHVDEDITRFGDSRLVFLNEEDRLESLRRFIDVWRLDMISATLRSGDNRPISTDTESEILFCSRAMLQMQNGFQLLLTIVVTRQMLCLVDERIYDWPDFIKRPSVTDFTSISNSSPLSSSSSQFQFLKTNAYFLHQIKSCLKLPGPDFDNILAEWCPIFGHSLQIEFYPSHSNHKEPIYLYFESVQKTANVCQIINQLCENQECQLSTNIICVESTVPKHIPADIPANLKYLNSSYHELRLSLSMCCPKLSNVAQSSSDEIMSFCQTKAGISEQSKIHGIFWSKFMYLLFDLSEPQINQEMPGLVCLSSNRIDIIFETEESPVSESECWSEPESDQPDNSCSVTKLNTISIDLNNVFKIYIGLFNQWVTMCSRVNEHSSEHSRLVLIMRNSDQIKQFISWMKASFKDMPRDSVESTDHDEFFNCKLEYPQDDSNEQELLFQIRLAAKCDDITLVHYTSVEDVTFDSPSAPNLSDLNCSEMFTYAVVVSSTNLAIIRHNIVEYPVRYFGRGAIRQTPTHLQYQIITVIPLYECLQLQLPGHDKTLLVIIIRSANSSSTICPTLKIQLSINCQKEQKHLIDKLRQQWAKCLQVESLLRVVVC